MALNAGSIIGYVGADNSAYLNAIDESIRAGERFAKTMKRQFESVGQSMKNTGRTMSIAITAPILAATGAMTKAAVDANETRNKFNVVFRDIASDANATAEVLKESFGLGSVESRKLLGDTGDLLTGFGFTQQAALDMSRQVQELAVDLASFTNVEGGATRASKALTAALLGEAEQVKALGIVIRQDSVEYKTLVSQGMRLLGLSQDQAKAQAALTIAISQSSNAIGDYGRTAGETANQQKLFWTRVKDSAEAIGQRLIPALDRSLIIGFKLLDMWNNLGPALQDQALQYALLAAAIGPVLLIGGGLLSVVGSLFGILGTGLGVLASLTTGFLTFAPVVIGVALGVALLLDAFGSLIPSAKSVGGAFVWLQGIWKETADFWGGVVRNILDNTETLTEEQVAGIGIIAKSWLALKVTWKIIVIAMQDLAIGLGAVIDGLVSGMAALADIVGLDVLAAGYRKTSATIRDFVIETDKSRIANEKAAQGIIDSWDKAPDIIRADIEAFTLAVSELGTQALEGLKGLAPDAVEAMRELIAEINAMLAAGQAGAVQIPTSVDAGAAAPTAPAAIETSGLAFLRQRDDAIEAANNLMQQRQFETLAALAESTRGFQEENISAWDAWAMSITGTFDSMEARAIDFGVSLVKSLAGPLSDLLSKTKTFSQAMASVFSTLGRKLVSETIDMALQMIAWHKASAIAKQGMTAPTPWLIPVYMAAAAAAFAAGMSGTVAGSSGTGSSGGVTAAPATVTAQVATVSQIEGDQRDLEPERGNGVLRVIIEDGGFGEFVSLAVKETKNGKGDGDDRLALMSDLGT